MTAAAPLDKTNKFTYISVVVIQSFEYKSRTLNFHKLAWQSHY